ncbi:MAG: FeoB-associated Cys-rich membrane protein [Bacteroidia bacterium]
MWQNILVFTILILATAFLAKRFLMRKKKKGGCDHCG